jgi:hypothetical protein
MWVQGDIDAEQRYIYTQNRKNHVSQQWDIIYKDQWKYYKKGDFHKDFGLYIERDFYIVSRMGLMSKLQKTSGSSVSLWN